MLRDTGAESPNDKPGLRPPRRHPPVRHSGACIRERPCPRFPRLPAGMGFARTADYSDEIAYSFERRAPAPTGMGREGAAWAPWSRRGTRPAVREPESPKTDCKPQAGGCRRRTVSHFISSSPGALPPAQSQRSRQLCLPGTAGPCGGRGAFYSGWHGRAIRSSPGGNRAAGCTECTPPAALTFKPRGIR